MEFDQIIDRRGTYCTQWDYVQDRFGVKDLLPFTISDTDFKVPDIVNEAIIRRISHPIYGYTRWNNGGFQNSVISWYQRRMETVIDSEWIVYSPSVMYSVSQLIQIVSKEDDGVIIQTPGYDAFFKTIRGNNRQIVENPLKYKDGAYELDFEDLEEKLKQKNNSVLLLCSPHNPTGKVWSEDELMKIIELCAEYDVFIISDEIHMDVLRKNVHHHPILKFSQNNIAIVTSASKTFNFPGLIFSYAIIPNEAIQENFLYNLKNKDGLSSTSILGLEATMAAYNQSETWVDELNVYIENNYEYVKKQMAKYFPEFKVVESSSTYLMWIDVSESNYSMEEIQHALINVGKIAIMDGKIYGGNGNDFLRLNIGCPMDKLVDGIERMKKSLL